MANPAQVACPVGVWTKIATNVSSGTVHRMIITGGGYLQTYRLTGVAAPTLKSEGVPLFRKCNFEEIETPIGSEIDVYVWAILRAGRVRADL